MYVKLYAKLIEGNLPTADLLEIIGKIILGLQNNVYTFSQKASCLTIISAVTKVHHWTSPCLSCRYSDSR
jgi:hypothetical protein